jgi:uncharacterized integral membrane protein
MTNPVNQPPNLPPSTSPSSEGFAVPAQPPIAGTAAAGTAEPAAPAAASEPATTHPAPGFDDRGHVRPSKVSGVWVGLIGTALFLVLLIIFIAQNSHRVSLHFLGWHGQFSLALTILLSAVIGLLLVAIPGTVRIVQLRTALRKNGPRTG